MVVVNITIILPSIIKSLAISASVSGEINISVFGGDRGSKDKDEPEEKFEPKSGETNIFLVGKYEVDSIENPTQLISRFSSPLYYKEYNPLISSIYVDDEKVEVDEIGQFQFKITGIHKVEIYFKKDLKFLDGFFKASPLVQVYLTYIDTSKITTMSSLFRGCYKLKKIYYGDKFNTKSLISMDSLFSGCKALTEIDLSKFNTTNVVNMDSLFDYCENLQKITFGNNFNTTKVTRMRRMFGGCKSLKSVDLSKFDTSKVQIFESFLEDCSSLESVDTKYIKTDSAIDISGMFEGCSSLTSVDISSFNTTSVIDISYLFDECTGLKSINFGKIDTRKVYAMEYMFTNCKSLTKINLSNFNTLELMSISYLFSGCSSLNEIDVSYLDTSNVNELDDVFKDLPAVGTITYSSDKLTSNVIEMIPEKWIKKDLIDSISENSTIYLVAKYDITSTTEKTRIYSQFAIPPIYKEFTPYISSVWVNDKKVDATGGDVLFTTKGKTTVKIYFKKDLEFLDGFFMYSPLVEVDFSNIDFSKVTSISSLFKTCYKLENINFGDNLYLNNLTSMSQLFSGCLGLIQIDLSKLDTKNVVKMDSLFDYCENLQKITFGNNFNTSKVLTMRRMFGGCKSLKSVDLSKFDTSKVQSFESFFEDCSSLESVDTKYIKTDSAYDISGMFEGCSSLTSVDISSFNTGNLRDIAYLFYQCTGLEHVNFGKIDTKLIFTMEYMLANCISLTEVDLSNFDTPELSTVYNLFYGCTSLIDIDISNLDCSKVESYEDIFKDLPTKGTIKYNSDKCYKIIGMIPSTWDKKDIA